MQTCALLHVEDADADAVSFRAALDEAGLAVSVYRVSDGEQALAFLNKSGDYEMARRPAVVVLDLNMPKMDGWTVLAGIVSNPDTRMIPVVVLSSSRRPDDQARALSLGAARYIVKPFDFDKLVALVRSICADFLSMAA
jgi:two-component system, chemotaxis family, response regulator Rcp1